MNWFKTMLLMALLTALMVGAGRLIGGESGMVIMFVISIGINFVSYWFSDKIVLATSGAREVDAATAPELYALVERLAKNAELPMPRVCIIESDVPNAFATGRNPDNAAVAVTSGIMRVLDQNELAGVLGHELAHVKHRDILIGSIAAAMAGAISMLMNFAFLFHSSDDEEGGGGGFIGLILTMILAPIAASLIQMAISRSREYDADKTGGEICGNPLYLASALEKIEQYAQNAAPLQTASTATAHMYIINPLANSKQKLKNLFSTHPLTADRIARLREQSALVAKK